MSTTPLNLRDAPEGCTISIRVHPGARTNAITGTHNGALKVSLTAPPTDGRANEALIAFLADRLALPRSHIELIAGASSRNKLLRIRARTAAQLQAALLSSLA